MSDMKAPYARAMTLAALCGSRIALGPAFLEVSRRQNAGARVAAAIGEMILDKLEVFPVRYKPVLLVPHTLAGAWVARESLKADGIDDPAGALAGAVVAAGVASVLPIVRIAVSKGLGVPDPLLGVAEDYVFLRLGAEATGVPMERLPEIAKEAVGEVGERVLPSAREFAMAS